MAKKTEEEKEATREPEFYMVISSDMKFEVEAHYYDTEDETARFFKLREDGDEEVCSIKHWKLIIKKKSLSSVKGDERVVCRDVYEFLE